MALPVREPDLLILSSQGFDNWHVTYIHDVAEAEGLHVAVHDPRRVIIHTDVASGPVFVHLSGFEVRPAALLNRALGQAEELLFAAELLGLPVINAAGPNRLATNKYMSTLLFWAHGLRVPGTALSAGTTRDADLLQTHLERLIGYPAVTKPTTGSLGYSVRRQDRPRELTDYIRQRLQQSYPLHVQQYVPQGEAERSSSVADRPAGRDMRVTVVGERVVGALERRASGQGFAANVAQGGEALAVEPTPELKTAAVTAARVVGLEFAGIDLIAGDDGCVVLEANACPNFDTHVLQAGFPVGERLIAHIIERIEASELPPIWAK